MRELSNSPHTYGVIVDTRGRYDVSAEILKEMPPWWAKLCPSDDDEDILEPPAPESEPEPEPAPRVIAYDPLALRTDVPFKVVIAYSGTAVGSQFMEQLLQRHCDYYEGAEDQLHYFSIVAKDITMYKKIVKLIGAAWELRCVRRHIIPLETWRDSRGTTYLMTPRSLWQGDNIV